MSDATAGEVSFTAKIMAASRAIETQRPDALFTDPFAERLAGADAIQATAPRLEEYERQGRPFTAVRTRFFDDFLLDCAQSIRQVVLLGAGMDTRAFRMNWAPATQVYEIDQPDVLTYKAAVLADVDPNCHRHAICADLRESQWVELLLDQGYQPTEPSVWLLEGLLYYLNRAEVHNLLTAIANLSGVGSRLGADVINTVVLKGSDDWAQYWQSSCDQPETFFGHYGWQASAVQPGEAGAIFGRFTYQFLDRSVLDAPHLFFVIADRLA